MPRKILDICDDGMVQLEKPEKYDCEGCKHFRCSAEDRWSPAGSECMKTCEYFANYRYLDKDGEEMGCPFVIGEDVIDKFAMNKEEVEEYINE